MRKVFTISLLTSMAVMIAASVAKFAIAPRPTDVDAAAPVDVAVPEEPIESQPVMTAVPASKLPASESDVSESEAASAQLDQSDVERRKDEDALPERVLQLTLRELLLELQKQESRDTAGTDHLDSQVQSIRDQRQQLYQRKTTEQ